MLLCRLHEKLHIKALYFVFMFTLSLGLLCLGYFETWFRHLSLGCFVQTEHCNDVGFFCQINLFLWSTLNAGLSAIHAPGFRALWVVYGTFIAEQICVLEMCNEAGRYRHDVNLLDVWVAKYSFLAGTRTRGIQQLTRRASPPCSYCQCLPPCSALFQRLMFGKRRPT